MPEKETHTLDSGERSIIRFADFIDYGLYLIYRRQTDKPTNPGLVEAITSDKMFRLLHKLSSVVSSENPMFDLKIGLDRNGIHGKGIAFQLKSAAIEKADNSYTNEEEEEIFELKVKTPDKKQRMPSRYKYSCKAIQKIESCFPWQSRLISEICNDGREMYRTTIGAKEIKEWVNNGRLDTDTADLIKTFANFINRLEDKEVICLGRHENIENTEDSIQFLFKTWKNGMFNILSLLEKMATEGQWPGRETIERFEKLYQSSDEMINKSEADREYYEKAYRELEKETNPFLRRLVDHQSRADIIWGDSKIKQYVYFGYLCHAFTIFTFFALALHDKKQGDVYRMPAYIAKAVNIDFMGIPCLIAELLKMDIFEKKTYAKAKYVLMVQDIISQKSSCEIFHFKGFHEGDLSAYIHYFRETLEFISKEFDRLIGIKPRRVERKQKQLDLSI